MRLDLLRLLGLALVTAAALLSEPVVAQNTQRPQNSTITMVVSSAPGGGYDAISRVIAQYLPNHLPNNPTIVVKNMPGAGGLLATNYMFNIAPKDGSTIANIQQSMPFEPLLGAKEAKYTPLDFNWLGTPDVEVALMALWNTVPVNSVQDLMDKEVKVGSAGTNSTASFYSRVLNATMGTKLNLIMGYESESAAFLAMERGELDGYPCVFYSALATTRPTWVKDGKVKLILQYSRAKHPQLPDVPFATDYAKNDEDRQVMEAAFDMLAAGRPYVMPPGVAQNEVLVMQKAFVDTFHDPAFIATARARGMDFRQPLSGPELKNLIATIYSASPKTVQRLRELARR
jgi:tripartite-type tricarboxylate transporter receptor subunit TctC